MTVMKTAELKALRAGWQPIETAPRDGTQVLATWGYTWEVNRPHVEVCETGEEGIWFYSYDGHSPQVPPTHWMPLPEPPTMQT